MSLFTLNKTGLLTEEISFVLDSLSEKYDWKEAEAKLYSSGLTSSKKRTYEIIYEIKKRFDIENDKLPALDDLIALAKSRLNSLSKSEVYYVYLYYVDITFSSIIDSISQIYKHNLKNPLISREDVKIILMNYLKNSGRMINKKTEQNWIGKLLSILKEINLFIEKSRKMYFINFGGITYETWTFFALDACLYGYQLIDAPFIKAFHISPSHIPTIIQRGKDRNWINYEIIDQDENNIRIKMETKYENITQWLEELK